MVSSGFSTSLHKIKSAVTFHFWKLTEICYSRLIERARTIKGKVLQNSFQYALWNRPFFVFPAFPGVNSLEGVDNGCFNEGNRKLHSNYAVESGAGSGVSGSLLEAVEINKDSFSDCSL